MTLRAARSRQRGMATDELGIVTAIIFIISLIAVRVLSSKTESALQCVSTAARVGAGASPEGLQCPVTKKPFVGPVCPDPDRHLKWPPRFDRTGVSQDLPAAPQGPTLEVVRAGSTVAARENGPTVIVDVKPRFPTRYLTGPLLQALCLVLIIAFFANFQPKDRVPRGILLMSFVLAIPSAWGLWATVPTIEGSYALEFDRGSRKVVRHQYLFGMELSPQVYEARGLIFFRDHPFKSHSLVLMTPESKTVQLIDALAEEDAVLASWLKARFP